MYSYTRYISYKLQFISVLQILVLRVLQYSTCNLHKYTVRVVLQCVPESDKSSMRNYAYNKLQLASECPNDAE